MFCCCCWWWFVVVLLLFSALSHVLSCTPEKKTIMPTFKACLAFHSAFAI